jgi:tRNA-splicing ligase RtcB
VNRHARAAPLPDGLEDLPLSDPRLNALRQRDGRVQFATLGRGNHFVEFQRDAEGRLWLTVHTGSRAMGQAIRDLHLTGAVKGPTGLLSLDAETDAGRAYLSDMDWARRYAAASRRAIVEAVAGVIETALGVRTVDRSSIACDHNHVRRETHFGEPFWVHRKGATSAAEGEPGVIPGSMGTASFHTEGRGHTDALCSSSHGAGRSMSRAEARGTVSRGRLHRELAGVWYDHRLADRLRDEAPSAYKDVAAVMRAQRPLTRTVRKLRPVLSYKGG